MMGVLQPAFLLGALALGIPILLHLIHRQRYPNVRFSTLDFFERTIKHNTLQTRLIDILLLILRIAALALFALACARPFLAAESGRAPAAIVLVLDNSGTMSFQLPGEGSGKTAFEAAKQSARGLVDGLHAGDRVAILPTVGPRLDRLVYGKDGALEFLEGVRQEFQPGDLGAALEEGASQLTVEAGELGRDLVIFSDGHAREWGAAPALDAVPARTTLYHYSRASEGNLAVTGVELSEEPAPAGVPVRISVAVRNFGEKASGPVKVELTLHTYGGAFTPIAIRSIPPGETRVVDFSHVFHSRDLRGGFAMVSGAEDAYRADDTYYFIPVVRDVVRALVVNGVEATRASDRASFFLTRALQPTGGDSGGAGLSPVLVDEADESELKNKVFYDYSVVVTANVGRFPSKEAVKFKEYLRHGGAWLAFLGSQTDIPAYNALGLLPGTLKVLHRPAMSVVLEDFDHQNRALSWFGRQGKGELSLFSFSRYFEFDADSADGTRVLATYSDGRPAIIEGRFGDGRVVAFTSSCHTDWADMPLRPAFLVMAQRLVEYLAGGLQPGLIQTQHYVGESLFEPKPKGPFAADRVFVGPDGEALESVDEGPGMRSLPVRAPGIYFAQPRQDAVEVAGLMLDRRPYAVNVPLSESEPEFLSPEDLARELKVEPLVVENAQSPEAVRSVNRPGSEYVVMVLAALLLVLVVESLVGWRHASESAM